MVKSTTKDRDQRKKIQICVVLHVRSLQMVQAYAPEVE